MAIFVRMNAMTVSAQNIALSYFIKQFLHCNFWVMANAKRFLPAHMIEIKRSRMRVIPAVSAAAFYFDFVN